MFRRFWDQTMWVALGLALTACTEANVGPCQQACLRATSCGVNGACALNPQSCDAAAQCVARCMQGATCEALNGRDPVATQALAACKSNCSNIFHVEGATVDGPPKPWDATVDGGSPVLDLPFVDLPFVDMRLPGVDHRGIDWAMPPDAPGSTTQLTWNFPQVPAGKLDVLFVIDNSNSMSAKQQTLASNFPRLIDALRGPSGELPDLRLGVVTSDLGAGTYSLPSCEKIGGDVGKLFQPQTCAVKVSDPYITFNGVTTNVVGGPAAAFDRVKAAFACFADVGTGGCGFEQTLESARRALDPKLNVNPGFIRSDAALLVLIVSDEDDCSAQNPALYDPNPGQITDPLGPLTSFRCFEFGFKCTCAGKACTRQFVGPWDNCQPTYNWLFPVTGYSSFFSQLKPSGGLLLAALTGPTSPVTVSFDGSFPVLNPSCKSTASGTAAPAMRIASVVGSLGAQGIFNQGTDASYTQSVPVSICDADYSPMLRLAGRRLSPKAVSTQCLSAPVVTPAGSLACSKGSFVGPGASGSPQVCSQSCLHLADCQVVEVTAAVKTSIARCPQAKFDNLADTSCGTSCPCWRLVPKATCLPGSDGSPYGVEVLRSNPVNSASVLHVSCKASTFTWGPKELGALPQCK